MKKPTILGALLASTLISPLFVSQASAAAASQGFDEKMLKCFEMTDEEKRIVCYDDISRGIAQANPEKQELIQKRAVADFGLTHQEQAHDEMIMQAVKVEREPGGLWLITMDNGQVWQQSKDERFIFQSDQPKVRIFKLWLGSYAMTEEGRSKKIRVKRVK